MTNGRERPGDKYWIGFGLPAMACCCLIVALFAERLWMHLANALLIVCIWLELPPLFAADNARKLRERERLKHPLVADLQSRRRDKDEQ
jgi:hypothetical protein